MATLSGIIKKDEDDTPISGVTVELYLWSGTSWGDPITPSVTTQGDGKYTYIVSQGKYKIQPVPQSGGYFFEPEATISKVKNLDSFVFDFIGTKANWDNQGNHRDVSQQMVRDVLTGCLACIDDWNAKFDGKDWEQTRQRVIKTVTVLLKRDDDKTPAFASLYVPPALMQPELRLEEARVHVYQWQEEQIELIERETQEQIERIARIETEHGGGEKLQEEAYIASVACTVCRDRYCTKGTIYYLNYPDLVSCISNPPCS